MYRYASVGSEFRARARLRYSLDVSTSIRMMDAARKPVGNSPEPVCGYALLNALSASLYDVPPWNCPMCAFESPQSLAPSILKFILIPGNIRDLEKRLSRCTCVIGNDDNLSVLHGPLPHGEKYSFDSLMGVVFGVCTNLLARLKQGRPHIVACCEHSGKAKKTKGITAKVDWLRDTSNLTPGGARSTVKVLTEWMKILDLYYPLPLFRNLVLHCPSLLLEMGEIIEQSSTLLMSIRPTLLLNQPSDLIQHAPSKLALHILLTADAVRVSRTCLAELSAKSLVELDRKYGLRLYDALVSAHAKLDPRAYMHSKTAESYFFFLDLVESLWMNRTRSGWATAAKLPSDPSLRAFLSRDRNFFDGGQRCWESFREFIGGLARSNICGHKPCEATADSIHQALRRCSRCGVLRYCSRECQKASWNTEGDLCHKTVCAILGKLNELDWESVTALPSLEEVEAWEQKVYGSGLTEADIVSAGKYMLAYLSIKGSYLNS